MRAPLSEISDNFAAVFVPLAFAVSAAALLMTGSIPIAITVLIMSTPCAVLLAAPSAVFAGIRSGINRDILIKGGTYLESIALTDTMVFDKTGTLTLNKMTVEKLYVNEKVISVSGLGYATEGKFTRDDKEVDHKEIELILKVGHCAMMVPWTRTNP